MKLLGSSTNQGAIDNLNDQSPGCPLASGLHQLMAASARVQHLDNGTKNRLPEFSSFRLLSETRRNLRIPYLKTAALDLKQKIVAQMLAQFLCEKPIAVAARILHGPT